MKKNWYENWFNEDYQLIYSHRDEKEIDEIIQHFESYCCSLNEKSVLDICCGLGRLSFKLAEQAKDVKAIDLSEYFINECKSKNNYENLEFLLHDMRDIKFENQFDAIFQIFTSFGYFQTKEENLKIFDLVYDALKPGGYYLFDFFNSEWVKSNIKLTTEFEDTSYRILQFREIVDGFVKKHISIYKKEEDVENEYIERVLMITKNEFDQYFKKIGFECIKLIGNYDGHEFDEKKSPRLIYLLKK